MSPVFISKEFRVCYDSAIDNAFYAYKRDGGYIHFRKYLKTLMYSLDMNEGDKSKVLKTLANVVTVKDKEKHFSNLKCTFAIVHTDIICWLFS